MNKYPVMFVCSIIHIVAVLVVGPVLGGLMANWWWSYYPNVLFSTVEQARHHAGVILFIYSIGSLLWCIASTVMLVDTDMRPSK